MTATNPAKILIVDDEPSVCEVLCRWLTAEGYDCQTAGGADEAWDLLEGGGFSLLVTDLMMPGKSGIRLLTMTRDRFPETAVIIVTVVDDRTTAISALELGAYGYVTKPFERNEVIVNVFNALERRRLALARREQKNRLGEEAGEQGKDGCAPRG